MVDPFTRTRFLPELKLESWHPVGVLDFAMAMFMVHYIGFEERIKNQPFNRFADMSKLTAIDLDFKDIAELASERLASFAGLPPVKAAFFAPESPAREVSEKFADLMKYSPMVVRVFLEIEDAARWLDVPVEVLDADY